MTKTALITGVTGQDGAYLSELLLAKGYVVHGVKRRSSSFNTARIDHLYRDPHEGKTNFFLHHGDLTDATNLIRLIQETQPHEIYNLAAQSHVQVSFETPEYTANADAIGHAAPARGAAHPEASQHALLPGVDVGAVRQGRPGNAAARDDAVLPAQPVCRREAVRLLDHGQLPRGIWPARVERHPVQPREPVARRDLRDPQDHARGRGDRARDAGTGCTSAISTPSATGAMRATMSRACGASCSTTRPTTGCWRRARRRASVPSSSWPSPRSVGRSSGVARGVDETGIDRDRQLTLVGIDPAYFRPDRGRPAARRRLEGGAPARLEAYDVVERARPRDGHRRPRCGGAKLMFDIAGHRVWVAGDRGMVGSAVVRRLTRENVEIVTAQRGELDLTRQSAGRGVGRQATGRASSSSPPRASAASPLTPRGRSTSCTTI